MSGVCLYVVSPYPLFCDLLLHTLEATQSEISCAGTGLSLEAMEDAIDCACPDVVLFDTSLCSSKDTGAIRGCVRRHPGVKFLLLYDRENPGVAVEGLAAGASSCISKQCGLENLLAAVCATANGKVVLPSELLALVIFQLYHLRCPEESPASVSLSERDTIMLGMIARGATNREIADCLGLSQQTVKNDLTKLFCHLGVSNRLQAAAWWRDRLVKA